MDDTRAQLRWAAVDAPESTDWELLPLGPDAVDTTEASIRKGVSLASHGMELAGLTPIRREEGASA
jgi:hypothetical protein